MLRVEYLRNERILATGLFRSPLLVGVVVWGVVAGFCVSSTSAHAEEQNFPVVGSFNVGDGLTGAIDERTGTFTTQIPLAQLPGLPASLSHTSDGTTVAGMGGFQLGVSYRQSGESDDDRFGLGHMWKWSIPFVETNGGVRVFPASGDAFDADASWPSGLARYTLADLVFSQKGGVLPRRAGVMGEMEGFSPDIPFAYTLEAAGVGTDYFTAAGDLTARVGMFGDRVDLLWGSEHRLLGVVDTAGSRANVVWTETGMEITSPPRSDTVAPKTIIQITGKELVSVTNPEGEQMKLQYENTGLLAEVSSDRGVATDFTYQKLFDGSTAIDRVRVIDKETGAELSTREWNMRGENTPSGWPRYRSMGELWSSGDGEYRYQTVLSDGVTNVVSEYNSLGLLVSRDCVASTAGGDMTMRTQKFTFMGTETGGVPSPQLLPAQYTKPTRSSVVFHNSVGETRTVTETNEYNETGQVTKHVASDGTITETIYDTRGPFGSLSAGLLMEQTVTGADGTVSKTVNTLTADHQAIQTTETFVGTVSALEPTTRTEFTVDADGFISEQKVVAHETAKENLQAIPAAQTLQTAVTRYDRTVNRDTNIATLSQTDAVGTPAQSRTSAHVDVGSGLIVSETDPTGRISSTSYDRGGRPLDHTSFSGLPTTIEYGKNVTQITDAQGITRREYVDVIGRIIKKTDNITVEDGNIRAAAGVERVVETRSYEKNSSLVSTVDGRGLKTVSISDIFGRPMKVTTPSGLTQMTVYDDVHNTVIQAMTPHSSSHIDDASRVTTTQKDEKGRDVSVTGTRSDAVPVPNTTTHYDGLGRVTEHTNKDLFTSTILTPMGAPKATTTTPMRPFVSGETITTDRQHDIWGASTQKTLTQGTQTREGVSRVVDAVGRTVSETDQAGSTILFEYTVDGLLSMSHNTTTGVIIRNTYDSLTRTLTLTQTIASEGTVTSTAFEYRPLTRLVDAIYDPSDRDSTRIRHTYDIFGNTTSTIYPDGKTISHRFDEFGQKISTTDIAGNTTRYEYNRLGLLSSATQATAAGSVFAKVEYEYDTYGRVTILHRDNGLTTHYTFTSSDEIATETTTNKGTTLYKSVYEYDSHGNLTKRIDTRPAENPADHQRTETTVYAYNAYDQLVRSSVYASDTVTGEPITRTEYEVGVSGNVLTHSTTDNTGTVMREFEYDSRGRTTAVITNGERAEQSYDTAGNLLHTVEGTHYTYNIHNQPLTETWPDGTTVEHTYWANGQRKNLTTSLPEGDAHIAGLYWDGSTLVNDTHTSSTPTPAITGSYLIGISRHTRNLATTVDKRTANTDYYLTDRHGNTTALATSSGELTTRYTYTDYGAPTTYSHNSADMSPGSDTHPSAQTPPTDTSSGTGTSLSCEAQRNPFQYAGEYTTKTGTQYLGNRTYTPSIMAFTTKDSADQFELYAYAHTNPTTLVDPTGQTPNRDEFRNGLLAGVGVMVATIGFATSVLTLGAGWGVANMGMALTGLADVGGTATQTVDTVLNSAPHNATPTKKGFMTDTQSKILGWGLFAFGLLGAVGIIIQTSWISALKRAFNSKNMTVLDTGNGLEIPEELVERIDVYLKRQAAERTQAEFDNALEEAAGLPQWELSSDPGDDAKTLATVARLLSEDASEKAATAPRPVSLHARESAALSEKNAITAQYASQPSTLLRAPSSVIDMFFTTTGPSSGGLIFSSPNVAAAVILSAQTGAYRANVYQSITDWVQEAYKMAEDALARKYNKF